MHRFLILLFLIFSPLGTSAQEIEHLSIEVMAEGLTEPWSIGFLPNGALITERGGRLLYLDQNGNLTEIQGTPNVQAQGQGGLFDVLISKNFNKNAMLYLSFSHADGTGTALARAQLNLDTADLENLETLFVMNSPSRSGHHFGGRILEAKNGEIYLTIGDRSDANLAQEPNVDNGKIIAYNPSTNTHRIVSSGHRNPQGLAQTQAGEIYTNEHGAKGGDEINHIQNGNNYGWPIVSYGVNYDGSSIGIGTSAKGFEEPEYYWDPSIAPSGMAIHSGYAHPALKDVFFVGSLKFHEIQLLKNFKDVGKIKTPQSKRVRDVREAPDGSIWFLSVGNGAAYRIVFQ